MDCPICHATATHYLDAIYDDRYGFPGLFQIQECKSCGHRFLREPGPSASGDSLYSNYYPRKSASVANLEASHDLGGFDGWWLGERSSAFRWVPPNSSVLDIGCGFGESLVYHRARGTTAVGIEPDSNVQESARLNGLRIESGLFSASKFIGEKFDFVSMDQVIEHVPDPITVLREIGKVLKPNGKIILTTPNGHGWGVSVFGRKWINWHVPYHLHFFSSESMKMAAVSAGYRVEFQKTLTDARWLNFQLMHFIFYPREKNASKFWKGDPDWTPFQRRSARLLRIVYKVGLLHGVTRLMDFLGRGDNRVVILGEHEAHDSRPE